MNIVIFVVSFNREEKKKTHEELELEGIITCELEWRKFIFVISVGKTQQNAK